MHSIRWAARRKRRPTAGVVIVVWHHVAMPEELFDALEIGPRDATHVFVWLHGLGDTGHGHEAAVNALPLPDSASVRFILPHAPPRPVTVNSGTIMPAWYDIRSIGGEDHDVGGIRLAADNVSLFIDRELDRGVPSDRIGICGFSQGGCVALQIALRYPDPLVACVGLSTYVADTESLHDEAAEANRELPVFLGHGMRDPMVPVAAMHHTRRVLEREGHEVTCGSYPMAHEICPEELADVGEWLRPLLVDAP